MRFLLRIVALLLLQVLIVSCGGPSGSPASPVGPSVASQPRIQTLRGNVGDIGFRPIAGARIEVLDGPSAGQSVTSDAMGRFSYTGSFAKPATVRATKEGYLPEEQTSTVNGIDQAWVTFALDTVETPVNVAGDYTLTFIADDACAGVLPADSRTRRYAATVSLQPTHGRPDTHFLLAARGPNLLTVQNFPIGIAGNHVLLSVYNVEGFGLAELTGPRTYLTFWGVADALVGASAPVTISASFNGEIDSCVVTSETSPFDDCYYPNRSTHQLCYSANHQLILKR